MNNSQGTNFGRMLRHSFFFSSLIFLFAGIVFVSLSKLLYLNSNTYNIILPFNSILLLACTAVSLVAVIRKQTALLALNLVVMLTTVLLSSSFLSNGLLAEFNMPWLQQLSWILLILGLFARLKKDSPSWNRLSLISFSTLATLMLMLLLVNSGTLWGMTFGSCPTVSLNTAIFLFLSATAGLTVSSSLRFSLKLDSLNLANWLALLLSIFSVLIWLNFMHQLKIDNQKVADEIVLKFQQQTEQILAVQKSSMQRLGDRFSAKKSIYQPEQISLDFSIYLRDFNYLDYIAVLDSAGNVHYSDAQSNAIKLRYDSYIASEYSLLPKKQSTQDSVNVSFYSNDQADQTFVRVQLTQPNALGLDEIIASINLQQVMQSSIPVIVPNSYAITLAYENDPQLLLSQLDPQQRYFEVGKYSVNSLSELNWRLELYRDFDTGLNFVRQVSEIILFAGWLACLLALLSQQYQKQTQWQQRRLIKTNQRLLNSLTLRKKLQTHYLQFKKNSADLLCTIDTAGKCLEVSHSSKSILDYSAEELKGRALLEFVHPDDQQMTEHAVNKIINGHSSQNFRNRHLRKDGSIVHLMWSARYVPSTKKMYAIAKDISDLVKAERYQHAQQHILQLISTEAPLAEILKQICLMAEEHNPAVKACVMLKVEQRLQIASAPSLSNAYHTALANVPIADNSGCCSTAAFQKKLIIVEDMSSDPNCYQYRDIVLAEQLSACWSMPLLLQKDHVLGTFTLYCKTSRAPHPEESELLISCCRFAANAIDRFQQKRLLSESQQRFQSLCQFNPDPVYALDNQGYFTDINTAGCALLESQFSELKHTHFSRVISSDQLAEVSEYFIRALAGDAQSFETSIMSLSGKRHELQITIIPAWIDGKISGVLGLAKNITQRLKTEKQLRLFNRAVAASSNGVVIADITQPDMPISYVNYAFEKLTGFSLAEVVGKNCRFLQGEDSDPLAIKQIRLAIESKQEISVVLKNYRKDGSLFWNNLFLSPVPDESGVITHYIGIQTDITEQKKYEQELAFSASHDLLTGLPNRSLLHDRLSQSVKMNRRLKNKVALIFIDLDDFKLINDSLGHLVGDEVICQISARITSQIRPSDTLARMGGDEFVLLLPDLDDAHQLNLVVERILTAISTPLEVSGKELQVTASIGISMSNGEIHEPIQLLQQADLAMYHAKQLGRNNAQWYSPDMEKALNNRLILRAMLKRAIENNEFELYYQPQVNANSGRLIGLEALLRWKHPERGFIAPDEFIPIAEETGLIIEIGQWVIEQAATYNRSLQKRGLFDLTVAVNVSPLKFQQANFVEQLETTLQKAQLAPQWFELELTESLLLVNIEQVTHKLQDLKQLGVSISIDDFGTGYSSLNYLKQLPIDKLKIDKSFTRDLVTGPKDAAITRTIIAMAHQLGLRVVAEGVETIAQATLLNRHKCDELQGYFYSKPLPAKELEAFFQHYLPAGNSEANAQRYNLLLIDDKENTLLSLKPALHKESFNILTCNSTAEAFEFLALHDVQVIVAAQHILEMSGTEFLSKVSDMYPETIPLVLSGATDLHSVTDTINHAAIHKIITAPWHEESFIKKIKAAFRLYQQQLKRK